MPEEIEDAIEDAAITPKSVEGDEGKVTARDIDELIKADEYLASKTAMRKKGKGIRFSKMIPPGSL